MSIFSRVFLALARRDLLCWMPTRPYLRFYWRAKMGYPLNLDHPVTFNEKLQWLKLYDRDPSYPMLVDKATAKEVARQMLGDDAIIPTLGVWDRAEDIEWDKLPNRFVLKCTHDSGTVIVCEDKATLDRKAAVEKLSAGLARNYYYRTREWFYKDIRPRVIAEAYLSDESRTDGELSDYKFYCFDGKPVFVMVCVGRKKGRPSFYYFDRAWNALPYDSITKDAPPESLPPRPQNLERLFEAAELLAMELRHVRVDLYSVGDRIYFGEWTLCSDGGYDQDITAEANRYFGSLLHLPERETER
ncbi:MAG: ATP-grasp fold amidoligase family protein [Eubacteriales bacterium]